MSQKKTQKSYSQVFKEEAVALVREQGYSVAEAARAVGVATSLLYKWKDNIEAQQSGQSLSANEREELKQLRKEVKTLRMEKAILKKASAFFAKEMA